MIEVVTGKKATLELKVKMYEFSEKTQLGLIKNFFFYINIFFSPAKIGIDLFFERAKERLIMIKTKVLSPVSTLFYMVAC